MLSLKRHVLDETITPRVRVGRLPIDRVTFSGAIEAVAQLIARKRGGTVFTPNADHIVIAEHDDAFCEAYEAASLSLVDGMPVLWASHALGAGLPEKISGSDFVPALLEVAPSRGWRIYLLGGAPGSVERAASTLTKRDVNIVGMASPQIDMDAPDTFAAIAEAIARTSPDLVLVGLGAPKQEHFAHIVAARLSPAVIVGVGATIDFIAGMVPRAPAWMSRAGLEWLYRLVREPRRLWRRYLLRDPEFVLVVLRQLLRRRRGVHA